MSVIKITNTGGVFPSVQPRLLGPDAAQTAHNLLASSTDFRPLPTDLNVATSGVNNPKTIYRLSRKADGTFNTDTSTGWLTSAQERSYVKGQLNEDANERTYYSIDDADAPPRATDASGADRLLGVPAPTVKPTVSLVAVDEYTKDDQTTDVASVASAAVAALHANLTKTWTGDTILGAALPGVALAPKAAPEFANPDESVMVRLYAEGYRSEDGSYVIDNTYSTATPAELSWVYSPELGGFHEQRTQGTAVIPATVTPVPGAGETQFLWAVPFHGRAVTYSVNRAAYIAALTAITVQGQQAITADQAAVLADRADEYISGPAIKPVFQRHRTKTIELLNLLDGNGGQAAGVTAFYTNADIVAQITSEKNALADAIWQFAARVQSANNNLSEL